jgi:hypothetical protein
MGQFIKEMQFTTWAGGVAIFSTFLQNGSAAH